MSRFLDLDAVARPDLEVRLGGQTYRIPGSISTPRMLRWMQFEQRTEDAAKANDEREIVSLIGEMYDDLLDLFRTYDPDLEDIEIDRDQTRELFAKLNEAYNPADEDDTADPTPPKAAPKPKSGRRSGSTSRTPASRS